MQAPYRPQRDLVLVGGGHTHALLIKQLGMQGWPADVRITLVSEGLESAYSGMLPGLVAGHYSHAQAHVDLARLCAWAGVRFVQDRALGLDPGQRRLRLAQRPALDYEAISLNTGACSRMDQVPGAAEHAVPVKPVASFWQRWSDCKGQRQRGRVIVVGGGAGGVELVLAMAQSRPSLNVMLLPGDAGVLPGYHPRLRQEVSAALVAQGVELGPAQRVMAVEPQGVRLADGEALTASTVFWCTGSAAPEWLQHTGLPLDRAGFVEVDEQLQVRGHKAHFVCGDSASLPSPGVAKAGVYAVRQAPILRHNLQAWMRNPEAPKYKPYRPQRRYLTLVSLGQRQALAQRGLLRASGAWVWRWKDRIDRQFMQQFAQLPPMRAQPRPPAQPDTSLPPCGGCGSKVAPSGLRSILQELSRAYPDAVGEALDEAADAVPLPGHGPWLQSVDSLRALVDDPWLMAGIATEHALSDLLAAGAQPVSVLLNLVLPYASSSLQARDLRQAIAGSLAVLQQHGAILAGGHSMQGPEWLYGVVANGRRGPAMPGKTGGQPGDVLILTKRQGSGVLFAAAMQGRLEAPSREQLLEQMRTSNANAARLALEHGARAMTDVTGFGLLGHLQEMLRPDLAAVVQAPQVPVLPQVAELSRAGIRSSLWADNAQGVEACLDSPTRLQDYPWLLDPQTSGGLLLAAPAHAVRSLLQALRQSGVAAAEVGQLVDAESGKAAIRLE
jgi:selenide,water dikinase